MLKLLGVPASMLPEVRPSSEVYGRVSTTLGVADVPIAGIAGDQQAALFGQMCVSPGLTKNTYGTGCFLLQNTGERPVASRNRLLSTVAWQIGGKTMYALEGSVFIGGAVVQWLRDGLGIIGKSADVGPLAATVPDNGGVYLVPAFAGLGAPHWDPYARGTIVGITRGTTAGHIAGPRSRASRSRSPICSTRCATTPAIGLTELRVDGGAAANDALLQFQADLLGVPVVRPASHRDDGARRRVPGRPGGRLLGLDRRRSRVTGASTGASSRHCPTVAVGGAPRGVARSVEPFEGLDRPEAAEPCVAPT